MISLTSMQLGYGYIVSELGVASVMYVGYVVFSYICVLGNSSNMIFILNFCVAYSVTHVGSAGAAWKFWGQLEMRLKLSCPFNLQCMWCLYSAFGA